MLSRDLKELKVKIESMKKDIEGSYNRAKTVSADDGRAAVVIERIIYDMESALTDIKYLDKPTEEGELIFVADLKRFKILDSILTCGHGIEIYNEKYQEWEFGRVEFGGEFDDYYFCNEDGKNRKLEVGMKARKRI